MKKFNQSLKSIFLILLIVLFFTYCSDNQKQSAEVKTGYDFSFAFFTDIHVQPEKNAVSGFQKAIRKANSLNPDFVLTGGDLIMDALEVSYERAESLYDLYKDQSTRFTMPVFNTMGNHEVFGWYEKSGVKDDHPFFGKKLFEEKIGKSFYSFDYKNWHFIILDSIMRDEDGGYFGRVSEEQISWLKNDLSNVDPNTPIVISTHIPLISVMHQIRKGTDQLPGRSLIIVNSKDVLDLFLEHNLKLVLQGHLHYREEIRINGITFISVGAVCGEWWDGPYQGFEEGFGLIKVKGDNFTFQYIDYGWEVK